MGLLKDKVAIITGAGDGIGRATASLFALHGARLVVNDLGTSRDGADPTVAARLADELRRVGGEAVASPDPVATPDGARRIVKAALDAFGRVDILVNHGGIGQDEPLLGTDPSRWQAVLEVHLTGVLLCSQAAAEAMKAQGSGGRIVNTTGIPGLVGGFCQTRHAVAGAGVYGLTRAAAIELQRVGITVNAVAPLARTRGTDAERPEELEDALSPEHVAPAYLFLASDLCGARTGIVLAVAGGRVSSYRMVESGGRYKEDHRGVWTAEEIAEHWDGIVKL